MDFVLNSRFIAGLIVGILLYTLWAKKQASGGNA
jgi:hypothetical protein